MSNIITIIGGGNGSHAMAADMTLAGHEVILYEHPNFIANIKKVHDTRKITISGAIPTCEADIKLVTSDIKKALVDSEVVFIPLPSYTHRFYAEMLSDYLSSGQLIVLVPGTFGSLVFKRIFKEKNVTKNIIIAETNSLTYDARLIEPGHVYLYAFNNNLEIGVMPSNKTDEVVKKLSIYYSFKPAVDVLCCGLKSLNPCLHVPGCVLNAGRIERSRGNFWLYEEGITPAVARVMEKLDEERITIAKGLGYEVKTFAEELAEGKEPRSIWSEVNGCQSLSEIKGPTSLKSRYFTEDIPYGLVPWSELGNYLGIDTPIINSFIVLGGLLIEQNPWEVGRSLKDMGIDRLSLDELKSYLSRGVYS